ncbi:MAG: exodeoxyribonuclease III [Deltaproteobacteria bacterium]|nr:MAG: exodeoxyribonuclease III [Deltaproteobacteria bacterium]
MKIATWNVNSIRVRAEQVLKWLERSDADVLCLQELKTPDEEFPYDLFGEAGYFAAVAGQRTYNGVAILSKEEPKDISRGLSHLPSDHPLNEQRRIVAATIGGVRILSAYMPNGESLESEKFPFKMEFFREFRNYLDKNHEPDEGLCICGDFNVAREAIDLYNPEERGESILVSSKERRALEEVLDFGLTDAFRLHNKEQGRYSWWDYRGGMYWKGKGMRIDYLFATRPLAKLCAASDIDESPRRWKRPSDHTVVWAEFDI